MRIMREYSRPVHIKSYDVDTRRQLKIPTLLAMCQESSEQQLQQFGLDHASLMQQDIAFLLARVKIDFRKIPMEGQDVILSVCPRGSQGAQYFREFQMFSGNDLLVEVMESWILVQISSRSILPPSTMDHLNIDIQSHRGKWNGRLGRIKMPGQMPLLAKRPIYYSDLDFNGHVSNIHYARFLLDALPSFSSYNPDPDLQLAPPKSFRSFSINYISECKWGDVLAIYGCEDENTFYLCGENQNGRSVECFGEFEG